MENLTSASSSDKPKKANHTTQPQKKSPVKRNKIQYTPAPAPAPINTIQYTSHFLVQEIPIAVPVPVAVGSDVLVNMIHETQEALMFHKNCAEENAGKAINATLAMQNSQAVASNAINRAEEEKKRADENAVIAYQKKLELEEMKKDNEMLARKIQELETQSKLPTTQFVPVDTNATTQIKTMLGIGTQKTQTGDTNQNTQHQEEQQVQQTQPQSVASLPVNTVSDDESISSHQTHSLENIGKTDPNIRIVSRSSTPVSQIPVATLQAQFENLRINNNSEPLNTQSSIPKEPKLTKAQKKAKQKEQSKKQAEAQRQADKAAAEAQKQAEAQRQADKAVAEAQKQAEAQRQAEEKANQKAQAKRDKNKVKKQAKKTNASNKEENIESIMSKLASQEKEKYKDKICNILNSIEEDILMYSNIDKKNVKKIQQAQNNNQFITKEEAFSIKNVFGNTLLHFITETEDADIIEIMECFYQEFSLEQRFNLLSIENNDRKTPVEGIIAMKSFETVNNMLGDLSHEQIQSLIKGNPEQVNRLKELALSLASEDVSVDFDEQLNYYYKKMDKFYLLCDEIAENFERHRQNTV